MRAVLEDFRARLTDREEIVTNGPVKSVVPPGWVILMLGHNENFVMSRELFAGFCPNAELDLDTNMYVENAAETDESQPLTDEEKALLAPPDPAPDPAVTGEKKPTPPRKRAAAKSTTTEKES